MVDVSKLTITFDELGMDASFVKQAKLLGLRTIADALSVNADKLKTKNAFTYMWYADLLNLLKDHDLLRDFQRNQL
ncbi:MAG TPA: hypothetical protein VF476_12460 [Chitinophagaceae bacterium]